VLTEAIAPERATALVVAELSRRLSQHAPGDGRRLWLTAPANAEARGLGSLLAITQTLSLPVDGFVDSAAVSAAALGLDRNAIALELGLHHAAATSIDCEGGRVRRRRATVANRGGLIELYQAWLELISKAMVKRTRFDPLHDAPTEQQLFDSLPRLASEVGETGSVTASVSKGTERFEVELSRDQFAQSAQPITREIVRLLHELRPAGASLALIIPSTIARLPGLRDELEQFAGCEIFGVPDGFAAAAASLLELPDRTAEEPIRLLRQLPAEARPALAESVSREMLGQRRTGAPPPSHVLWNGQAYALTGTEALVVGRAPGVLRALSLSEGLAGVSRRHCTFIRDGDELILLDHSSFGTFVNGERVAERVRVYAGDRVRVGEPGVELSLIAVGET
jgi:hypothetical protein